MLYLLASPNIQPVVVRAYCADALVGRKIELLTAHRLLGCQSRFCTASEGRGLESQCRSDRGEACGGTGHAGRPGERREGSRMPVRGFALTEVRAGSHLGDQAVLAAL